MSQRNSGHARIERDAYMTPRWVTQVLLQDLEATGLLPIAGQDDGQPLAVWEPAAGTGQMADVIAKRGYELFCSDIHPSPDTVEHDFLTADLPLLMPRIGAVITNPPYNFAERFVERALQVVARTDGLVAMLLNDNWDAARTRRGYFGACPQFARKVVLCDRITWFERQPEAGKKEHGPSENHAWFVWSFRKRYSSPTIGYVAMPEEEKKALAARRKARRLAVKADRHLELVP